jgi:hypothetical protein
MEEKAEKERKKIVVEEVSAKESPKEKEEKKSEPQILDEAAKTTSPEAKPSESISSDNEIPPKPKKRSSLVFWIVIPGIFLLGAIVGGIIFYQRGVSKGQEEVLGPTPAVSATPTASPSATFDLSKYTIAVYNGSGIAGEAGKVKTLLTNAGFKVSTTTNAANYDYTKTIIKAKSAVEKAYTDKLNETLLKTYEVDTLQTLATSSATDVQVVVGSTKASE